MSRAKAHGPAIGYALIVKYSSNDHCISYDIAFNEFSTLYLQFSNFVRPLYHSASTSFT